MPLAATRTVPVTNPIAPSAHDVVLPVTFVSQRPYKNLCWAACGSMILQYYSTANSGLTDIVTTVLGSACKGEPVPGICDIARWPQDMYAAYGYSCQYDYAQPTPQFVQAWINNTQPIQPYYQWDSGEGNHTVLIVGWYANEPVIDLLVYDPLAGIGRQSFDLATQGGGPGSWQGTWYDIRPPSNPSVPQS
jgi:hypothetical protein